MNSNSQPQRTFWCIDWTFYKLLLNAKRAAYCVDRIVESQEERVAHRANFFPAMQTAALANKFKMTNLHFFLVRMIAFVIISS
jgi:hypothetical protein